MVLKVLRDGERGPKIESAHKERGVWRGSTVVASSVRAWGRARGGNRGNRAQASQAWPRREMMGWII